MGHPADALIVMDRISVSFQRWGQRAVALDGVSMRVADGEWLVVRGHNGAGKSTLLKAICSRVTLNSGQVLIAGRDVAKMSSRGIADNVFLVHQDPQLSMVSAMTVQENLLVADENAARLSRRALAEKHVQRLGPLRLADRMKQSVRSLSGGERQLLSLLVARLRPSKIILLDEPLSALDASNTALGLAEIEQLHKAGKTIVQVAHEYSLLEPLADRFIVMSHGQITEDSLLHGKTPASRG